MEPYDNIVKLEDHTFLSISTEIISEVAEALGGLESADIRINWLDQLSRRSIGRENIKNLSKMLIYKGSCR